MGNGWVSSVLAGVALDAEVVLAAGIASERTVLLLHLVRSLPGTNNDLDHPAHGLAVAAHHADGAQVVQQVFGGYIFCGCGFHQMPSLQQSTHPDGVRPSSCRHACRVC